MEVRQDCGFEVLKTKGVSIVQQFSILFHSALEWIYLSIYLSLSIYIYIYIIYIYIMSWYIPITSWLLFWLCLKICGSPAIKTPLLRASREGEGAVAAEPLDVDPEHSQVPRCAEDFGVFQISCGDAGLCPQLFGKNVLLYGYGSITINTIFSGMNIPSGND